MHQYHIQNTFHSPELRHQAQHWEETRSSPVNSTHSPTLDSLVESVRQQLFRPGWGVGRWLLGLHTNVKFLRIRPALRLLPSLWINKHQEKL